MYCQVTADPGVSWGPRTPEKGRLAGVKFPDLAAASPVNQATPAITEITDRFSRDSVNVRRKRTIRAAWFCRVVHGISFITEVISGATTSFTPYRIIFSYLGFPPNKITVFDTRLDSVMYAKSKQRRRFPFPARHQLSPQLPRNKRKHKSYIRL
ncbi:hypothetical protein J6590_015915 [Homalodisca vitripennis]|nr:hypothetical protein J6590_015915 [Homalodisca vitripennis]